MNEISFLNPSYNTNFSCEAACEVCSAAAIVHFNPLKWKKNEWKKMPWTCALCTFFKPSSGQATR